MMLHFSDFYGRTAEGDTVSLWHYREVNWGQDSFFLDPAAGAFPFNPRRQVYGRLRDLFRERVLPMYYEEAWILPADTFRMATGLQLPSDLVDIQVVDRFSEYGIVPYHLLHMQNRLTEAFRAKQLDRILRLAAEMGHYIGDAHVPLHTTENYNGQLTDQVGIHAFWESRIPELFADEDFNFWVGRAEYIQDPGSWFWDIVLASHLRVDSVLQIERQLSLDYPRDQQYCFDQRLERTVRIQCAEYAQAYREAMHGMVERRWEATIQAIGSSWYTAWIDAGQPDLKDFRQKDLSAEEEATLEALNRAFRAGLPKGRKHEE